MGILTIIMVVIITKIPVVGDVFRVLNILVHEVGHLVATKMVKGETDRIELSGDVSGIAYSRVHGGFGAFFVTIAGYPFSSLMSLLLMYLVSKENYTVVYYIIFGIVLVSLVLWVRNKYGIIWSLGFLVVTYTLKSVASGGIFEKYLTFLVTIILIEALYTTIILVIELYRGNEVGDADTLQNITGIPRGFWVGVFFVFSLVVFVVGIGI